MKPKIGAPLDTAWITKDQKCWIYDPSDIANIYIKGKIKQLKPAPFKSNNSIVVCELEDGSQKEFKVSQIEKRSENTALTSNLTDLQIINDAQILYQLSRRFKQKKIFTFIGTSLLIINPYQQIPDNFNQNTMFKYYKKVFVQKQSYKQQQPHIYGLVSQVLKNIQFNEKSQSINISGESGSGKTQTNKYCLKYLTYVCSKFSNEKNSKIQEKILNCNPILEAFGNAKTIKNDNSSRFGKLIILKINKKNFRIRQAFIKNYFLEKSRITYQNKTDQEKNFHIFYYFVNGLTQQEKIKYAMKKKDGSFLNVSSFQYLKNNNYLDNPEDKKYFQEVKKSLSILEFAGIEENVWNVLAAILHLGNLNFDSSTFSDQKNTACEIVDQQVLQNCSRLLGIQAVALKQSILFFKRKILNEITNSPQNSKKCLQSRDSIVKALYQSLFQWLVQKLNVNLKSTDNISNENDYLNLKLLDIYGFQVLNENSFQQLCVNYTNQRLHQIYIQQIFKQQKKVFQQEGLSASLATIKFNDNNKLIQLLDTQPKSIYNLIDQGCTVGIKQEHMLDNIKKNHLQKPNEGFPISNKNLTKKSFIIKHTPGQIQYSVIGFQQKNKDYLRQDLIDIMQTSTSLLVSQLFKKQKLTTGKEKNARFLGKKLREEINKLIIELQQDTELHFVRCIKPNERKQKLDFVPQCTLNQIKYLGLLDTIILKKSTYHLRMPYDIFYKNYGKINFKQFDQFIKKQEVKEKSQNLFKNTFKDNPIDYLFGNTRIFLKEDSKIIIDKVYKKKMKKIQDNIAIISNYIKSRLMAEDLKKRIQRYNSIKKISVMINFFLFQVRRTEAAKKILAWWNKNKLIYLNKKKRKACINIQKYFKRIIQINSIKKKKININIIQKYFKTILLANWLDSFRELRNFIKNDMIQIIWEKNHDFKINNIEKYLKWFLFYKINKEKISYIQQRTYKISKVIKQNTIKKYLKSFYFFIKTQKKMNGILKIQSIFRGMKLKKQYLRLRKNTIKIQRFYKKYYYTKKFNYSYLSNLFDKEQQKIKIQNQHVNDILFKTNQKNKKLINNIDHIFREIQLIKNNKIYLFYYLLDFQQISDISYIYENHSWINNYFNLYKQLYSKSNQLQYLQVGQTHTLCSSSSKIYNWGWNQSHQLGVENIKVDPKQINTINLPNNAKIKSFQIFNNYSSITFSDPPSIHYFGDVDPQLQVRNSKTYKNLNRQYILHNGVINQIYKRQCHPINFSEKITQISCGNNHIICKTSLKKIYTWGNGSLGQLGHGDFLSRTQPKLVEYFTNQKLIPLQVSASHSSSIVLLSNQKLFWFGKNNTIDHINHPIQIQLEKKSNYIWDQTRYTPIRIVSSWSKTISTIGITFACHYGCLSTNISLKKKVLQILTNKWNEHDIETILPPYLSNIARYFTQKSMRISNYSKISQIQSKKKNRQLRLVILKQLNSLQHFQKDLDDSIQQQNQNQLI